ncbi:MULTISPECIES: ABC transporter permease [unclassified Virgibacillus]|uniref:ABC transporter permease n=1 Tax=unclassified Virgibacillus TaxID=2620237 RepID=UPI0024DE6C6A|nr:ABC transporter permease [Virgibacillus sp. LDC-1]
MFDSQAFFKRRFSAHMKETSRYLRYIFNGHIAVAMLFFISAAAYYYQQWLAVLPEDFPAAWIIGIAFGLIASYSPVRTLLKEPDLVFLIAAEHRMGLYFRNVLLYSFIIQLYIVLFVSAALGPLYFAAYPERSGSMYLMTILVLLVFKGWNLLANWWMLRIRDKSIRTIDTITRFMLNGATFYFLIIGNMPLATISTVLFVAVFLYDLSLARKQAGLAWDFLIEKEQSRMQAFYRLANMFTDVPHLKNRVRKRSWLVRLIANVPFEKASTYDYLYRLTFVRSGDYLGMYIRLVVIGALIIFYVPNLWMQVLLALLFIYMSSFQMMTLYQHHRTIMWLDLYPLDQSVRQHALKKWILLLATVQTVLFSLAFVLVQAYAGSVIIFVSGMAFNFTFIPTYIRRKLAA